MLSCDNSLPERKQGGQDATTAPTSNTQPIDIEGIWDTATGRQIEIQTSTYRLYSENLPIVDASNADTWFIVEFPRDDEPFMRIDWSETPQGRYLCFREAGESVDELSSLDQPDATDLVTGCSNSEWTEIRSPLPFEGEWAFFLTAVDFKSFSVTLNNPIVPEFNGDWPIIHRDPDESWMVMLLPEEWGGTGMSYFAWAEKSDLFYLCADDLTDYTGTESSLSDLDDDLDNTDLDNGCAGNPWMPFVEALPIRGIWQSIGLLPTHLFATVAASEDTVAEARIDWTVSHVDTDQQTMLLEVASTENVEIPDFKRHMKLQWHTNASDQHFICVLGNAPSSEEAQTIPTEVYSAGSCGVSWYGQDATWHPLIPTG